MISEYSYEYFQKSADFVLSKINQKPEIAIILGSCLGPLADEIENKIVIDYADIPNFLLSTVQSHAGKLIFGSLNGVQVVCMSGRFHYYEGYDFEQLTAPIRLFKLLGVKATILTNAAGGINESYKAGDLMIIKDHIKLAGASPLRGKNVDEFGDRFFDTSDMYTESLRNIAKAAIPTTELTVHEGIYYYAVGPNFETPAEIRAMRILGGDAVGMSTVTEALTAAHCKMPLLAISLITNMAAGVLAQPITVEEVDETAQFASKLFREYLKTIIANI